MKSLHPCAEVIHQASNGIKKDGTKKRNRPSALLYHQMHQKSSRFENNTTAPRLQHSRAPQKKKRPILVLSPLKNKQPSTFSIKKTASSEEDLALLTRKEVCDPNSEATQPTTPKGKNQSTLLAFKEPIEATVPSSNDASFKDVLCAIEKLSLKVDQFGSQHSTLQQLVFEDDNVRANIVAMKEVKNIYKLTDMSEFLEFFYDEDSETSILRCLPCLKYHIMAKPTIRRLTPFEAQQIICSSSNGTFAPDCF